MGMIAEKLGKRIKELRESKGLTQFKLAELLNMEASNLSKIERGVQIPKEESLQKLIEVLNVEISDLFNYEHFNTKDILLEKINSILQSASEETIRQYYKILVSIM